MRRLLGSLRTSGKNYLAASLVILVAMIALQTSVNPNPPPLMPPPLEADRLMVSGFNKNTDFETRLPDEQSVVSKIVDPTVTTASKPATSSPLPTPTMASTPTNAPITTTKSKPGEVPASYRIDGVPVFGEAHNLSCEYASARMIAAYWGVNISENQFINFIGANDNPHLGFRGDIDGIFGGVTQYGVYAEPIARFLQTKGFTTRLLAEGQAELQREVSSGHPVLVWITYQLHNSQPWQTVVDGVPLTLVPWEHAVVVTGYDETGVYVNGPADATRAVFSWEDFSRVWGYYGNMALSFWPKSQPVAEARPGISPLFYRTFLNNGRLKILGLPLTDELNENGKIVQYFEQARLEYDPKGRPSQVIGLGRLGYEVSQARLSEPAFLPIAKPASIPKDQLFFNETGHTLANQFLTFWQDNGERTIFGLPISQELQENGSTVQYFERVRLQYNSATNSVTLGDLGRQVLRQKQN